MPQNSITALKELSCSFPSHYPLADSIVTLKAGNGGGQIRTKMNKNKQKQTKQNRINQDRKKVGKEKHPTHYLALVTFSGGQLKKRLKRVAVINGTPTQFPHGDKKNSCVKMKKKKKKKKKVRYASLPGKGGHSCALSPLFDEA
jgi:hypothetical protein